MLRSPSRPLAAAASLAFVYVLGACGAPDATPVPTQPAATPTGFVRVRLGASSDAQPALRGPSLLLQGSGSPVAAAFQAHLDRVASAPVDVVVLAASLTTSGSRTPECDRIMELRGVASCETITLLSATAAREPALVAAIDRAEVVFFAGGDQCNYVGWRESPVIELVRRVYARGGGVGGGSAGLAIQGAMIYDGCTASATSSQVLANPFASSVTFSGPLFTFAPLRGIITDSHFVARDRMGRLVGFLARFATPPAAGAASVGLGIDEGAALVVDARGLATMFAGAAYAVHLERPPDRCAPAVSLVARDIRVVRLLSGDTLTLGAPLADRGWLRTIDNGRFTQDPYTATP